MRKPHGGDCDHDDCRERKQAVDRVGKEFQALKDANDGSTVVDPDDVPQSLWNALAMLLGTVGTVTTDARLCAEYREYRQESTVEADLEEWALAKVERAFIRAFGKPRAERESMETLRQEAKDVVASMPPEVVAELMAKMLKDLGIDAEIKHIDKQRLLREGDVAERAGLPEGVPTEEGPEVYWVAERAHPVVEAHWNEWCHWVAANAGESGAEKQRRYDKAGEKLKGMMEQYHPVLTMLTRQKDALWPAGVRGGTAIIATNHDALRRGEDVPMYIVYVEYDRNDRVISLRSVSGKPKAWGTANGWEEARWLYASQLRHPEGLPAAAEGPIPDDLSGIDFDKMFRELPPQ